MAYVEVDFKDITIFDKWMILLMSILISFLAWVVTQAAVNDLKNELIELRKEVIQNRLEVFENRKIGKRLLDQDSGSK